MLLNSYLRMLGVLLLELLCILESDPLPVLHDAQLLAGPGLPQAQAHLVTPAHDVLHNFRSSDIFINASYKAVLRIRFRMFLDLPDPDP
jgi:hypothetical protein